MKSSLINVAHIFCLGHDTHAQSTFFYWIVFCPYLDQSLHIHVLGLKYVFEIILQE